MVRIKKNKVLILMIVLFACTSKKNDDIIQNRVLNISYGNKNSEFIKEIIIKGKFGQIQKIKIDTLGYVQTLENVIEINNKKRVNTWYNFDIQGNFVPEKSNYFETYLTNIDSEIYIVCHLDRVHFLDGKQYILNSDYDLNFNSLSKKVDTIYFDKDYDALIPLKLYQKGWNKKRFIINDEKKTKNKIYRRCNYSVMNFYIED